MFNVFPTDLNTKQRHGKTDGGAYLRLIVRHCAAWLSMFRKKAHVGRSRYEGLGDGLTSDLKNMDKVADDFDETSGHS